MTKRLALVLVVAMIAIAGSAGAVTIVNSKHDLSAALPTTQQVCVFCHTPHQPDGQTTDPLWNHQLSAVAAYGVYDSPTLDATPAEIGNGTAVSNLCMSCHDGTVGPGSLYNEPNTGLAAPNNEETPVAPWAPGTTITGNANMGTDLTNDHPVNFTYDTALVTADAAGGPAGLVDPAADPTVAGWLIGGSVQCSSCHDVHDPQYIPFLRASNVDSALCTTCHIK